MIIDVNTDPVLEPVPSLSHLVQGRWISSFQGHIQDDPDSLSDGSASTLAPPPVQLGAYVSNATAPGGFGQIDGFYVFAALADVVFGFERRVSGAIHWNIGKDHQVLMSVTGEYDARMGRLSAIEGEFAWRLAAEGYSEIEMKGHFVFTRANELTWVVIGASRAEPAISPRIVSGGRMRRAPSP
jgi:hypothetical protein